MELMISIDQNQDLPLYRALADAIKKQIVEGRLKAGESLPSVRELASSFGTSRSTILRSYEILSSQGFVEMIPKSNTRVSRVLPGDLPPIARVPNLETQNMEPVVNWSVFAKRIDDDVLASDAEMYLDSEKNPSVEFFPIHQWRKCLFASQLLDDNAKTQYAAEPFGHLPLRQALVRYLSRSRAVKCDESRIVITPGWEHSLDLFCRLVLRFGDWVAMENPGSPSARGLFQAHGANIHYLSSDREGLRVQDLRELPVIPKLLFVTPSHHYPTGTTLSLKRRLALLEWAFEKNVLIWEDDSACEYRFGKRPIPSLQRLSQNDSVIYSSTFTQTLAPIVNFACVVLPQSIAAPYKKAKSVVSPRLPVLEQSALAMFIDQGYLERHIYKSRTAFEKLRQSLIFQLKMQLGDKVEISKEASGTSILVKFCQDIEPLDVELAAELSGLMVEDTTRFYSGTSVPNEYLINFTCVGEAAFLRQIEDFSHVLANGQQAQTNDLHFDAPAEHSIAMPITSNVFDITT